ncbi:MAG TPA: hypothetical protein VGR62_16125 [Candidatus Binatia bacterium]|nr:hypothetical protein [Candidatus Binatia bacterium]
MEQADDGRKFAIWMDQLVQILTRVAHHYGGVFDKFTGDGALIHFLEEESLTSYDRNAIAAASDCAAAMHLATSLHINRLRQFLRVDSNMLGATIGIDLGQAHWSLDHRYNPITVGRGVVGACRLSSGPAGRTRLSNLAYQQLMKSNGPANAFRRVPFASKDYNPALEPVAWESDVLGAAITSKAGVEVRQLCDEVYSAERSGDEYDASTI